MSLQYEHTGYLLEWAAGHTLRHIFGAIATHTHVPLLRMDSVCSHWKDLV